jgi:hypothetical protein
MVIPAMTPAVAAEVKEYPLYAGRTNYAGKAIVTNDSMNLTIKCVGDGWGLFDVRVSVATNPSDIPQKNGNPIPGHFVYSGNPVVIPLNTWSPGTKLAIAIHVNARKIIGWGPPNLTEFALTLPAQAYVSINYPGTNCYFNATISNWFGRTFSAESYCVDTDHTISPGRQYVVTPYSSYEPLPAGIVSYPENFDLVNWIFNQNYIGKTAMCGGTFTSGDIQVALWALMEATPPGSSLGTVGAYTQCKVDEIVNAAKANGEGYVPPCGGYVVVVLLPNDGSQVIIIPLKPDCTPIYGSGETAWAGTVPFPGKNWANYLEYIVQE